MSKLQFPSLKAATVHRSMIDKGPGTVFSKLEKALRVPPDEWDDLFAVDPLPTQWQSVGLCKTMGADFPLVQSDAITLAVQINERMLPAKVRDEALQKVVASIQEREARRVSKKEYRELRDEVETELLPKAFIKRSVTLVTFTRSGHMITWTSSARRFDVVFGVVLAALSAVGINASAQDLFQEGFEFSRVLTNVVTERDLVLIPGTSGVFTEPGTGDGEKLVRVKNVPLDEIQGMVQRGYSPRALAMGDGESCAFTLNTSFVFSKIIVEGATDDAGDREDRIGAFESSLFLTTTALRDSVKHFVTAYGKNEDGDDL